jgi:uncharacterized protein YjiS (DUF1127 family)
MCRIRNYSPYGKAFWAYLAKWRTRSETRRHLAQLTASRLADIGYNEDQRRRECAKWFWQA